MEKDTLMRLREIGRAGDKDGFRAELKSRKDDLRLNLGSGAKPREGYLNVDIRDLACVDLVCDVWELPKWIPNSHASELFNSDFIEHFSWRKAGELWVLFGRLLKTGGRLDILTPNLDLITDKHRWRGSWPWLMQCMYGLQTYEQNYHKALYNYPTLSTQLTAEGFICRHLPNEGNLMHLVAIRQ